MHEGEWFGLGNITQNQLKRLTFEWLGCILILVYGL